MKFFTFCISLLLPLLSLSQSLEIYVCDAGNFNNPPWQILKFDENGENPSAFISTNLNWPQDILFLEDSGTVLISNLGSGRITRHDKVTGVYLSDFATGINGPTRMKIGPDSLLYVLQWNGLGKVRRYTLAGMFVDEFTSVGVSNSIGIDWDADGNLYVSSYNGDFVRKFDTAGVDMGIFVNSNLAGPTNIWFDNNGELLVADYDGTAVKRFSSTGSFLGNFLTGLGNCEGVGFLPNGDILIGNGGTSSVKQFDSTGTYIQDFISSGSGNLLNPNAVVIRNLTATSIADPDKLTSQVIYPTLGHEFYLHPESARRIEELSIFSLSGSLVLRMQSPSDQFWNADGYPEGMYLVRIRFRDGSVAAQRIQVRK